MSATAGVSQFSTRMQRKINRVLSGDTDRDPTSITITANEVSLQSNRTNELSEIADVRVPADYVYAFPRNKPIQFYLMTHEQFSTNTTGGDTETFTLSNNLVDSPTVSQQTAGSNNGEVSGSSHNDLVLYDAGSQVLPNTIDYAADEFTYENAEANADDVDAYYLWGNSSEIEGRTYTDDFESHKKVMGATAGAFHRSNLFSDNQMVTFRNQFALNSKEHLKFHINTAVDLTNWDALSGGGPNSTSSYSYFQLPVYKIPKK